MMSAAAVASSITPIRWLPPETPNVAGIQLMMGLFCIRGAMPIASYSVNFMQPNHRNTITNDQRSSAIIPRDPDVFSAILNDENIGISHSGRTKNPYEQRLRQLYAPCI